MDPLGSSFSAMPNPGYAIVVLIFDRFDIVIFFLLRGPMSESVISIVLSR